MAEPGKQFQFTLRESLGITALTGIGLLLLSPLAMPKPRFVWPDTLEYDTAGCLLGCLLIVAVTLAGAFLGLWGAHRRGATGNSRTLFMLCFTAGSWGVLALVVTPRMATKSTACAAACKCFAEAQEIYRRKDWDGDGVLEYAQSLSELYETSPGKADVQMIDSSFAKAEVVNGRAIPKAGYVFKVLKSQGPSASGGAKSYLTTGPNGAQNMTEGYAFLACPAQYDQTGRDCFMINQDGIIFQADMSPNTRRYFEETTVFDPDPKKGWLPSE